MKKRADVVLFEKGLVDSREKAKRVIMEGIVFIGSERVDKPGDRIDEKAEINIKVNPIKYVSRGGLKLEKGIKSFNISLVNKVAMDVGASTGGFTDCMIMNGALKVYAVDVGYGQLDWELRNDPRVVVMERTNIRNVQPEDIEDKIDFVSIDVSFISLRLVLPVVKELLGEKGEIVALVKPQFEAGRHKVGKKGIVRDENIHFEVLSTIIEFCHNLGLGSKALTYSPITGAKGNIEFLLYLKNNGIDKIDEKTILQVIKEAQGGLS